MVEREHGMQPDMALTFSNELASVLGFRKTRYWNVGAVVYAEICEGGGGFLSPKHDCSKWSW